MNIILGELGKSEKFKDLAKQIENNKSPIEVSGLVDVGMTQILVAINEFNKKPICIVTYNEIQAKKLYEDIKYFTENVVLFTKKEVVTYDYVAESKDLPYDRIEVLNKIVTKKNLIIITTVEALMQKLPSKEVLYKNILKLKVGMVSDLEKVKKQLVDLGYSRTDMIEGKGQFSVRGGILDISESSNTGIRIEFWGDEIDSIRNFSIVSQRSINTLEKVEIYPAHEYILEKPLQEVCKYILENEYTVKQKENVDEDIEQIKAGEYISKVDKYFNSFYNKTVSLIDYLSDKYLIALDEINKIEQRAKNIWQDNSNLQKNLIEKERIVPDAIKDIYEIGQIEERVQEKQTIYLQKTDNKINVQAEKYEFKYREVNYYKSEIESFIKDINKYINENKKVFILVSNKEKANKLKEMLEKEEIICKIEEKLNQTIIVKSKLEVVTIGIGRISTGFECFDINTIVIWADDLIDGNKHKRKLQNADFKQGETVVFADLKIGDYVVHKTYGIGNYIGVNTITADGTTKDYIKIKYLNDDVLYVPTNQLDSIRKYIGGDSISPKINRLGSKDWENTKAKVKRNLREVAKDLIELYAKREKSKGFAFSKDTPWQNQFENSFQYQETEDQLRCIEEVKKDMEQQKPMDRLLCGDVGYGNTEGAIRAAFKAVMDQKQVAYLAPTTVLAQQQYEEFKERMKEFPIRVEILNRFKSKKYQNEVIKKLQLGEVDIVVGTHRLLSKDVEFKNLGLLIIDEEHRFGVRDKEKIKQYKTNVDVLTMTATPIPRTMHMSIVGVRDMSVIYEPPHNRKPVQTYVLEYDEEVIKEAITKELERGGQVFYLFNNVKDIQKKADSISNLVPESNVTYAHGQMTGNEIEEIMKDFIEGNSNVLVCTTILESGIDIPNANTIIVENADRMGLAQLYQIRGRVGRADKQAYAYITYKKDKLLSEVADKRLKAIKEFTEFGSGFKIAMRDLEIRGAGSLLGEIQSGHLEQVGYETYCKLLDEVVKEMQGIKVEEDIDVQIDLNVTSYIPDTYISDSSQKIEIYQNIALCKSEEDIQNVVDEIIDRFGEMPKELETLMQVARIKYLSKQLKISKISQKKDNIVFVLENRDVKFDINELVKAYKDNVKFSPGIKTSITIKVKELGEEKLLIEIIKFLNVLKKLTKSDIILT